MTDADTINPPVTFDPYSIEFAADPYPVYKRLRDEAPVFHQEDLNIWVLSRYEDVWQAHRDAATFSSAGGVTIEGDEAGVPILIVKDAPEHGWAKAMMTKVFSRTRMAGLESFIRDKAVDLLERAAEQANGGEIDFVHAFSVKLPLEVISELLGIPQDLRADVHRLTNSALARGAELDKEAQYMAMAEMTELYRDLAEKRRANPGDDPISLLIATEIEDEAGEKHSLNDFEIACRFSEMAGAGHETVAKTIAAGVIAFTDFPEERRKVEQDPALIPTAVQEILRFQPPSQLQGRTTTRDVTLHGVTIPKGSKTMLCTGGATHDERAFPDPERFDIARDMDSRTVFFGFGVHKCLGIHLAQLELNIAFQELFARFPDWRAFPERATRSVLSNVRGVDTLPFRFGTHA